MANISTEENKMSKVVTKGAAQGDILIVAQGIIPRLDVDTTKLEAATAEDGRLVLARGEATGHHHSLPHMRGAVLFRDMSNVPLVFTAEISVPLDHQEHSTINFAPGKFNVIRQRTYHAGMARRVAD
jgi:hypothetical protein